MIALQSVKRANAVAWLWHFNRRAFAGERVDAQGELSEYHRTGLNNSVVPV